MKLSKILIIMLFLSVTTNYVAKEQPPFNTVQRFFSALSNFDFNNIKVTVTNDFQLLEMGEVWDTEYLINALKSMKDNTKFVGRRNYFSVIRTVVSKDNAWVSYWNKAEIIPADNGQNIIVTWLESAVLIRVDNKWKIQMLHSTKVEPKAIPEDIKLEEYVD